MVWVLNAQTRSKDRPSLKYSSGGSGPLWKFNEAFCLPTQGGGRTVYMRYFSMFSGIGGFEKGIQSSTGGTWECIGYSELNKYAIQVYEKHFKGHKNYGDATRIIPEQLPDFDFLCGGFPCQAFSIAGKRGGFNDTRGTLFFEISRILSVKRPKLLLLENVKGLLSHDNGRTFGTILSTLSELGYFCEWQVLNSKDFGVPQNRERVFIVGHLGSGSGRKVFPISENGTADIELPTLTSRYYGSQGNGGYLREITAQGTRIRRLTPTECERLQGFPDGWTEFLSDSARYKCLGNAVTVNVIEAIIRKMVAESE